MVRSLWPRTCCATWHKLIHAGEFWVACTRVSTWAGWSRPLEFPTRVRLPASVWVSHLHCRVHMFASWQTSTAVSGLLARTASQQLLPWKWLVGVVGSSSCWGDSAGSREQPLSTRCLAGLHGDSQYTGCGGHVPVVSVAAEPCAW
jgi:hypothetical protein